MKPETREWEAKAEFSGRRRYKTMMQYKGYSGKVEYDDDAEIFHGEVIGLRDVITFQGKTVDEIKQAFRESVDDYLDFCVQLGQAPEKPFTGKFMLRLTPDLHRKVFVAAKQSGESINGWVVDQLQHLTANVC
jgi:predicted HicB family RNase H-like nuclease